MKLPQLRMLVLIVLSAALFSCVLDKPVDAGISVALANYWNDQTDLTSTMEGRDATMEAIQDQINGLSNGSSNNDIAAINALVETYATQSVETADSFRQLQKLEDNIRPYGVDKGIFTSVCKDIYVNAEKVAISSGKTMRSGWSVLSGQKSLPQILGDPLSGMAVVSSATERLARHNADRDAAIRQSILSNNDQAGMVPLAELVGFTLQDKLNSYLNLDEDSALKLKIRRDVMCWDAAERTRTAETAKLLGETGVNLVGNPIGAEMDWTNEVLSQHLNPGQSLTDIGTYNLSLNRDADGTPPLTGNKTVIINKANTTAADSRITLIMDAPQYIEIDLPSGVYDFIVIAQGHIRTLISGVTILPGGVQNQMAKLLTLADNAIVLEGIAADKDVVNLGQPANIKLTCASTIGKGLNFTWTVTGGSFTAPCSNKNEFCFQPLEESIYLVYCTVSDNLGNTKNISLEVPVMRGALNFVNYSISAETFADERINPGESASMELEFANEGTASLVGTVEINGLNGIVVGFTSVKSTLNAGCSSIWDLDVQCPTQFTAETGQLEVLFHTADQYGTPITFTNIVEFPINFYVAIDPIHSPVSDRVIHISGKVANPMLASATMMLDGDPNQVFQLDLVRGVFSQQIVLGGADFPVVHDVLVRASSGPLIKTASTKFTSDIPGSALRVTLSWDTPGTDLDLWVTDPNGEKCYYGNATTASGLVLDFNDTDGFGPENITTLEVLPGDYLVQVHYLNDHDPANSIPTIPSVVIRKNEGSADAFVNTYYGALSDTGEVWTVGTMYFNGTKWSQVVASSLSN